MNNHNTTATFKAETCETHGKYQSRHLWGPAWTFCPTCSAERTASREAEACERKRQQEQLRRQRALGDSGIPERFRSRTLDGYVATTPKQRRAHSFAIQYAKDLVSGNNSGQGAVFIGKPGTGKTHLAVGIGFKAMEAGYSVLFTTSYAAFRRMKSTWGSGSNESEASVFHALTNVDLLILDEVGVQFGSDTEKLMLFDWLNERYMQYKPTIFLSNLDIRGVSAYLTERIMDRLREDGGEIIPFDWESYRARKKAVTTPATDTPADF